MIANKKNWNYDVEFKKLVTKLNVFRIFQYIYQKASSFLNTFFHFSHHLNIYFFYSEKKNCHEYKIKVFLFQFQTFNSYFDKVFFTQEKSYLKYVLKLIIKKKLNMLI